MDSNVGYGRSTPRTYETVEPEHLRYFPEHAAESQDLPFEDFDFSAPAVYVYLQKKTSENLRTS